MLKLKIFILATLIALSTSYTVQDQVLVLTDDDFPGILKQFSHILIQFYAPWCGHCKTLAPVYVQVAKHLKQTQSVIKLAKVDATVQTKAAGEYQVQGYPTLFFFYNGQKMDYNGGRTKQTMLKWLQKRTRDPIQEITQQKYKNIKQNQNVAIIYHGDIKQAKQAQVLNKLAMSDDYNTYYWGKDLGRDQGTIQIIRKFGDTVTYQKIDDGLKNWIHKYDRPPVVPFDERTIGQMFASGKKGVVLFNGQNSKELLDVFTQAASEYDGDSLVFTEVSSKSQHLDNFANYIKINRKTNPIVLVDAGSQNKYVLKKQATKENILEFLGDYQAFKYGLTDQVRGQAQEQKDDDVAAEEL